MGILGRPAQRQVLLVDEDEDWLRAARTLAGPLGSLDLHTESVVSRALAYVTEVRPSLVITAMSFGGSPEQGMVVVQAAKTAGVPVAVLCSTLVQAVRAKLRDVHVFDKARFLRGNVAALLDHLSRFRTEWGSAVERFARAEGAAPDA